MASYSRIQLENWLKQIDVKRDLVLDVGGSQLPIKGRTKSWEVGGYKILDLAQPHELTVQPDIVLDLNKQIGDEEYDFWREKFDVAFCLEVSEYWWDPVMALKNIRYFLKPRGLLYVSFHFIYPVHNPPEYDFLRYTPAGARTILSKCGFDVIEIMPRLENNYVEPELENEYLRPIIDPCFLAWAKRQGMRPAKDYNQHEWQGCLIKAVKVYKENSPQKKTFSHWTLEDDSNLKTWREGKKPWEEIAQDLGKSIPACKTRMYQVINKSDA